MVGHRAETGQVVVADVHQGTVSPAYDDQGLSSTASRRSLRAVL